VSLSAKVIEKPVNYFLNGQEFESILVYDDTHKSPMPGILMVPNQLGANKNALKKAHEVSSMGYVVMLADVFGIDKRPTNSKEARMAVKEILGEDRTALRERLDKAVTELKAMVLYDIPLKSESLAAVGFDFGGSAVLDYARSGCDLNAVVSFYGSLKNPNADDVANVQSKILILHGAADPFIPQSEVEAFTEEMNASDVDWQLVQFGGGLHAFSDPHTFMPGRAEYNPVVSRRAFMLMDVFLKDSFTAE